MTSSNSADPDPAFDSGESGMPIVWFLPLLLGGLIVTAVLPVVSLGFVGAWNNTSYLQRDRNELVLDVVVDRIAADLDQVRAQVVYMVDAVKRGEVDPQTESAIGAYLAGSLAGTPQVVSISYVRPDGTIRRQQRDANQGSDADALSAVRQIVGDVQSNPLSKRAEPFWSQVPGHSTLLLLAPLFGPTGNDMGDLVATVPAEALSRSLAEVARDAGRTPFILVGRDHVLAHPALAMPRAITETGASGEVPLVTDFEDPVLARIWTRKAHPFRTAKPFRRSQGHWSWFDSDSFTGNEYVYRMVSGYGPNPWTVGFHQPSSDSRRERWTVFGIGIGGAVLLSFALGIAFLVARRLGKPVSSLVTAAMRVEAFDFVGAGRLPRGPVREINQAAGAVERMAKSLASFETYVPKALVRRLRAAGHNSQTTEMREVTIMFTDLEHYTEFSSVRPAEEVVSYLNDLLARIGPIIEAGGGTIDKYIGDSVMAFWGAPEWQPDHARAACLTACAIALEIESFNAARRAGGFHACRMRIGLHSGEVAVGNVGFTGRVDYTIIGRTVNVAQRLEQGGRGLQGKGETIILTSDQTCAAAGAGFLFEPFPEVNVAGVDLTLRLKTLRQEPTPK